MNVFQEVAELCDLDVNHAALEPWPDTSSCADGEELADYFYTDREADCDTFVGAAVPHSQVETPEFYKHISQDLVEPKRMRQLLMWCGHRALPEKGVGGQKDAAETAAMHAGKS